MEKSTVSRTLARMIRQGWLRATSAERFRRVTVAPKGRRRIVTALESWRRAQSEAGAVLGEKLAGALFAIDEL